MLHARIIALSLFFCLLFALALTRLVELQFLRSAELAAYRDNRLSHVEQKAPRRGRILDADGKIIAEDQPTQDLWILPARVERVNNRRQLVSNFPPLTPEQMLALARTSGSEREFELNLAIASLVEGNAFTAELARRLNLPPEKVAKELLDAVMSGRPTSTEDLVYPRPAFPDVDYSLAMEIRGALANPYDDGGWRAVEVRTGGKRTYPVGAIMGHITGTVGKLTAEEYLTLRGRWDGETKIPGTGRIMKQGREFFSIITGRDGEPLSDEEVIIRLREVKRSGKIIQTQGYLANEMVGRGGLEQYYNQQLRGRHRLQDLSLIRDESSGLRRFVPKGGVAAAVNGQDIRLSLRLDIQRQVHEIMQKHIAAIAKRPDLVASNWVPSGVAILMDPRNGRIHAMVSIPSYDPNTYNRDFDKLTRDPGLPLLDRAMSGIYPPGSVVKPLVGLAALSEDAIRPNQTFNCDRVLMLAGARFTCLGRHGDLDLESALQHSCNIFFYHAGENLGGRKLYEWYNRYGLGHRTGIDVAGEAPGILPRAAYSRRGWATGNTYHMAIGQGVAITPLQIAVTYAALANADRNTARIVRPHLLIPPATPPDTPAAEALAREAMRLDQPIAEILVDREAVSLVREGLWRVVQGNPDDPNDYGTGIRAAFRDGRGHFMIELAGKTGTAEWSENIRGVPVKQISHVWFAGYAPFDRPEVVVVVMLPEAGLGGGTLCAPIAKDILRMWFNLPDMTEEANTLG